MPNRALLWRGAGLLFSLLLAILLVRAIDLTSFREMATGLSTASMGAALLCYLALNIARTLRFRALLEIDAPAPATLLPIVLVHNLLVRALPFKAGELSWMILLRRHFGQEYGVGIGSLAGARLFELLIVLLTGGLALTVAGTEARLLVIALLLPGLALSLALLLFSERLLLACEEPLRRWPTTRAFAAAHLPALIEGFARLRRPRVWLPACALSLLTWSMSVSFNLLLLDALGIRGAALLTGVISIVMLVEALPVASISGIGMIEGGWTFGLVSLYGLEPGAAAATGFFLHACQLLAATLTGLAGWLWLRRQPLMAH